MAAAIGSHEAAARQWLDEGFSPGDAAAYVAAGCFDVPRTAELRQAGISALDIARTGHAWDYCSGSLTLAEIRRVIAPVLEAETALLWEVGHFSADPAPAPRASASLRWQGDAAGGERVRHKAS